MHGWQRKPKRQTSQSSQSHKSYANAPYTGFFTMEAAIVRGGG